MTRKNISKVVGDISDKYLNEAMNGFVSTVTDNPGEVIEMKMRKKFAFRKSAGIAVAACLFLALSVTGLAASGVLQGFFRDITSKNGTIVGTSYEQASDEISMEVTVNDEMLTATVTFVNPQLVPYSEAEQLGIASYQIIDANGKVVTEGATESAEIVNGQVAVDIKIDDIDSGSYKLLVTSFVAEKKADQPLNINGNWECDFAK